MNIQNSPHTNDHPDPSIFAQILLWNLGKSKACTCLLSACWKCCLGVELIGMGHVCVQYFLECHMFFTPWLQFSFYRSPQDSASLCLFKFCFFDICEIMSHCGANEGKQIFFMVSKCVRIHQALPRDITQQEDLAWAYLAWAGVTPSPTTSSLCQLLVSSYWSCRRC